MKTHTKTAAISMLCMLGACVTPQPVVIEPPAPAPVYVPAPAPRVSVAPVPAPVAVAPSPVVVEPPPPAYVDPPSPVYVEPPPPPDYSTPNVDGLALADAESQFPGVQYDVRYVDCGAGT
jgi:hypothetical protein